MACLVVLLWIGHGQAISGRPSAIQLLTVSSTAVGLTCTTRALVQVLTNAIYYTLHSATFTPTSSHYPAATGTQLELEFPSQFRAVRQGTTDATLISTCFE